MVDPRWRMLCRDVLHMTSQPAKHVSFFTASWRLSTKHKNNLISLIRTKTHSEIPTTNPLISRWGYELACTSGSEGYVGWMRSEPGISKSKMKAIPDAIESVKLLIQQAPFWKEFYERVQTKLHGNVNHSFWSLFVYKVSFAFWPTLVWYCHFLWQ